MRKSNKKQKELQKSATILRYWKLFHPDKYPCPKAHLAVIKLNKAFKNLQDHVKMYNQKQQTINYSYELEILYAIGSGLASEIQKLIGRNGTANLISATG
ncbi:hypothetical protein E3N88_25077 [Mikania micrantha]|uniref:J domain-containing protein n=1 Tax=Mikania micrantha TaxID=192012 RepID=A0A5N6N3Q2_9ASTR|nr:hypothetical protein E3N88_25077 [Mikania micrantha]